MHLIDGREVVYLQPNRDAPRGYQLFPSETEENENKYKLAVAVNSSSSNTITHIQWDDHERDTFETEIDKSRTSLFSTNVVLNGK